MDYKTVTQDKGLEASTAENRFNHAILVVIQQRKQTIQVVNKRTKPTHNVSHVRISSQRMEIDQTSNRKPSIQTSRKDYPKYKRRSEVMSSFCKNVDSCYKPNHFPKNVLQKNKHPTLRKRGPKQTKFKEMRPTIQFSMDKVNTSRTVQLKKTWYEVQLNDRKLTTIKDVVASMALISAKSRYFLFQGAIRKQIDCRLNRCCQSRYKNWFVGPW